MHLCAILDSSGSEVRFSESVCSLREPQNEEAASTSCLSLTSMEKWLTPRGGCCHPLERPVVVVHLRGGAHVSSVPFPSPHSQGLACLVGPLGPTRSSWAVKQCWVPGTGRFLYCCGLLIHRLGVALLTL